MEVDFQAYGRPLVVVSEFKYLGRVLTASYDNWPEVVGNLGKARKLWARMSRIIGQKGADPRTLRNFYKVVVQATLLFGAESWDTSPQIGRNLGRLQQRLDLHMALYEAMDILGLEEVKKYVLRRQNIASQYIAAWPILEIYLAVERYLGVRVSMI